jgi:hypothetical protein
MGAAMQFVIFHRLPNGEIELAYEPASDDEDDRFALVVTERKPMTNLSALPNR